MRYPFCFRQSAIGLALFAIGLPAQALVNQSLIGQDEILEVGGAAANVTFYDRLINQGELRVSTGSRAVFFGLVSGGGSFTGGGVKQYEGGLSLGNSPALVSMEGEVEIVGNQVIMELAGATPGNGANNHDKIIFSGPVTLTDAPDLVVVLLDGYRPTVNTRLDLFDWDGGVTGSFDLVLPTDYQWDTSALYSTGDLVVTAALVPEPETWAMLLAGLGMVGLKLRQARRGLVSARLSCRSFDGVGKI